MTQAGGAEQAAAAVEAAFALCTAYLHRVPERRALLAEVEIAEARSIITALVSLEVGQLLGLERSTGVPAGEILRRSIARYHQCQS